MAINYSKIALIASWLVKVSLSCYRVYSFFPSSRYFLFICCVNYPPPGIQRFVWIVHWNNKLHLDKLFDLLCKENSKKWNEMKVKVDVPYNFIRNITSINNWLNGKMGYLYYYETHSLNDTHHSKSFIQVIIM